MRVREPSGALVVEVCEGAVFELQRGRGILGDKARKLHGADADEVGIGDVPLPRPIDRTGKFEDFRLHPHGRVEFVLAKGVELLRCHRKGTFAPQTAKDEGKSLNNKSVMSKSPFEAFK